MTSVTGESERRYFRR